MDDESGDDNRDELTSQVSRDMTGETFQTGSVCEQFTQATFRVTIGAYLRKNFILRLTINAYIRAMSRQTE